MGSGLFGLIYVICQIMFVQVRILSIYIHLYVRTWVVHWYLIIVPRHHLNRVQVGGNMDIKMAIIILLPSIEHRSCIEGVVS